MGNILEWLRQEVCCAIGLSRELGMRMSEFSRRPKLSQPDVSLSVERGEKLQKKINIYFLTIKTYKLKSVPIPRPIPLARSVLAYWAVRELGISGTKVGKRLGLSQSAVSRAVQRGEQLVLEHRLSLYDTRNA